MLLRQGGERTDRIDRLAASSLAAIAGALNAAVFYAVGFFSANMTGNVSALSDHLASRQWMPAVFYASIVLAFVVGAFSSATLISAGHRRHYVKVYAFCILVEGLLMALLGIAEITLAEPSRAPVLILGLSFLMGLQNAVVTHISDARIRTTHVSGMATDVGIELSALIFASGVRPDGDRQKVRARLRLHVQTIACFLTGGVAGVLIFQAIGMSVLFVAALALVALASGNLFSRQAK